MACIICGELDQTGIGTFDGKPICKECLLKKIEDAKITQGLKL